jgi:hypothetical protein
MVHEIQIIQTIFLLKKLKYLNKIHLKLCLKISKDKKAMSFVWSQHMRKGKKRSSKPSNEGHFSQNIYKLWNTE